MEKELSEARERMRPKPVLEATVSETAWEESRKTGERAITKEAEVKSLEQRRHLDCDIIFKDARMRESVWNKPKIEGGLDVSDKLALANKICEELGNSQGRASLRVFPAGEKERTGIYQVGDSLRLKLHNDDMKNLGTFAEAVGVANSEAYQRHVVANPGKHPEVLYLTTDATPSKITYDNWERRVKAAKNDRPGKSLNTDVLEAVKKDIVLAYGAIKDREELERGN